MHSKEFNLSSVKPPKSIFFALLWMLLAALLSLTGYFALIDNAPFTVLGLMMLAILLCVVALQRTARFSVDQAIFNRRIRILALLSAVCGIGTIFYVASL